jgi:hypothetical protein
MEGDEVEFDLIRIYTPLGQDVSFLTTMEERADRLVTINLTALGKGFYFIRTKSSTYRIYKE